MESCYIETSVLYGGERFERERHIRLAHEHGFTQLPVVIADGARGEEDVAVPVNLHHFSSCHIARLLAEADQVLVLSHFKGHMLAGFGGALKQLSMGFASKGGKMAMHMGVKPRIRCWKCRRCGACLSRCNEGAITLGDHPHIDHAKCVGCGACFSICPHRAISILSFGGLWNALFGGRFFREKLAEYACASSRGKRHIYLNFALNITKGCDCEPHAMKPVLPDIGLFLSSDPVAVDAACWDAAARLGKSFRGQGYPRLRRKVWRRLHPLRAHPVLTAASAGGPKCAVPLPSVFRQFSVSSPSEQGIRLEDTRCGATPTAR
ncbi:MAG: DUF362 domain-containing protein [Lentisphaeria bacterium]|nr:MAG: DUF362 domain-containing protein [Lentisphaeria bacterium]